MLPVFVHPAGKFVPRCGRLTFKIRDFFPPVGSGFCSQIDVIQLERKKKNHNVFSIKHKSLPEKTNPQPQKPGSERGTEFQWQIHHKNKTKVPELAESLREAPFH